MLIQRKTPAVDNSQTDYYFQFSTLNTAHPQTLKTRTTHKTVSILLAMILAVSGMIAALGMFLYNSPDSSARVTDPFSEANGCYTPDDNIFGHLGWNMDIENAALLKRGGDPLEDMLAPQVPNYDTVKDQPFTALEKYGYYLPNFTSWGGLYVNYDETDSVAWSGTGGTGNMTEPGPEVAIENPGKTSFFAHDAMQCYGLPGYVSSIAGNFFLNLSKTNVALATIVYDYAVNANMSTPGNPIYDIGQQLNDLITEPKTGLKDIFFLDFLIPMVMIAAIIIFRQGIMKRSFLQAGQSAVWVILAACVSVLFLTNPLFVVKGVDTFVSEINSSINSAITSSSGTKGMCSLPTGTANQETREVSCSMWYTGVYIPWSVGQFDANAGILTKSTTQLSEADKAKRASLTSDTRGVLSTFSAEYANKTFNPNFAANTAPTANWALFQLDRQQTYGGNKGADFSEIAYNQIVVNDNSQWGSSAAPIGNGILSFLATIAPTLYLLSTGVILIVYQIMLILLILLSPIYLILGIIPGWGRGIAMRWLELMVGLVAKRILLTLFLAIYIKFYMIIMESTNMNWFTQVILVSILAVVAFTQRKRFVDMIVKLINFGGNKNSDISGQQTQMKAQSALNALQGATIGAAAFMGARAGAGNGGNSSNGTTTNAGLPPINPNSDDEEPRSTNDDEDMPAFIAGGLGGRTNAEGQELDENGNPIAPLVIPENEEEVIEGELVGDENLDYQELEAAEALKALEGGTLNGQSEDDYINDLNQYGQDTDWNWVDFDVQEELDYSAAEELTNEDLLEIEAMAHNPENEKEEESNIELTGINPAVPTTLPTLPIMPGSGGNGVQNIDEETQEPSDTNEPGRIPTSLPALPTNPNNTESNKESNNPKMSEISEETSNTTNAPATPNRKIPTSLPTAPQNQTKQNRIKQQMNEIIATQVDSFATANETEITLNNKGFSVHDLPSPPKGLEIQDINKMPSTSLLEKAKIEMAAMSNTNILKALALQKIIDDNRYTLDSDSKSAYQMQINHLYNEAQEQSKNAKKL